MGTPLSTLGTRRSRVQLSLTPLIDVVFILLVFFMLVSQFADWRQIDLRPQAMLGGGAGDTQTLIVGLYPDQTIRIGDRSTQDLAEAAAIVRAKSTSDGAVVIQPRDGVAIQPVIDLVEALDAAEVRNVRVDSQTGEPMP